MNEQPGTVRAILFRHSKFDIVSSFAIQISTFT